MFATVIKERLVNVRLKEKTHEEFKIACDLRGASMSSLLHQFIVRTIREEKDAAPYAFITPKHEHDVNENKTPVGKLKLESPAEKRKTG